MIKKIHPFAGGIGFLMILTFWSSTVASEMFGTHETVAFVKGMILKGMFVLVPSMAIVGATGMSMGQRRKDLPARAKKKRMPFIAANGLLVLLPLAVYLEAKASAGEFDTTFFILQGVELIAGAVNLTLMGMSIRDGRAMGNKRRQATIG
ncbi:hypothetical protein HKX54_11665 [Sulfitobacter sp. M57]|uniref:hypothetical protein n=1 Tax=unclassified Sulfitobacter TaxID=196795 RepID=UPI0023E2BCC2|nr:MULTISPECIES: hypothetical protein [unclassified Sulfitobacter]MDF3415115.1 hypothetical protein [Sulfitobacter sp. KE5]MDF3422596.1 hypothetical protein [Sulfitobacter sp. KE43]MDF3433661.1 hypothetical protein [Sulfitobacter sp. KE42]MDF3459301.1 hypothetical protein [Sulfitobacter sp. S74]MDF3463200.1 hypothetical protein [Sulfitobacter sp. Ks18]